MSGFDKFSQAMPAAFGQCPLTFCPFARRAGPGPLRPQK